jgi:hypothetical protein
VVEHERDAVQLGGDPERGRQLPGTHEQVVDQAGLADRAQPPPHAGASQPVRVRLVLHQVPDAGEPVAARQRAEPVQLGADVVAGEVHPADHPGYLGSRPGGAGRDREEFFGFRGDGARR